MNFQRVIFSKIVQILGILEKDVSCPLQRQGKDMNEGRLEIYLQLENIL